MKRLFKILLTILLLSITHAQFLDAVRQVEFDGPGSRSRSVIGYKMTGSVKQLPRDILLEGVALRFSGDSTATVTIQFLDSKGIWSKDYKAKIFPEPNSNRFIASVLDYSLNEIHAIRYEVNSENPVHFLKGGVFEKVNETILQENRTYPKLNPLGVEKPKVISRSEWGANDPKYSYSNHPYFDKMTLHHAAGWGAKSLDEGKAAVKSIQEFHQDGRGWSDIGYHFVVDMAGNIYQGRPETVLGAHVGGANTGNIGVCILGCYHPPETSITCRDEMTYNTEKSLIHLYAWISDTYGIEPTVLKGHRDYFGTTSCPGDNVWPMLTQMRADIALYIQYGEQPTRYSLFQNYPNPFNASTTLHYDLPEPSKVRVIIYDILGRKVIELVNDYQNYGYKKIIWNGMNESGEMVPPGIYFYKAELGPLTETKKMVLLK